MQLYRRQHLCYIELAFRSDFVGQIFTPKGRRAPCGETRHTTKTGPTTGYRLTGLETREHLVFRPCLIQSNTPARCMHSAFGTCHPKPPGRTKEKHRMNNPRFARNHLTLGPVPTAGRLRHRQDGGPIPLVCPPVCRGRDHGRRERSPLPKGVRPPRDRAPARLPAGLRRSCSTETVWIWMPAGCRKP